MRGRWIWAYLHRQKKHLRFLNRGVIFSEPSCRKNNPAQDTKPTKWETGGNQWGQRDIKAVQQVPDAEGMDQSGSWVKEKKRVWASRGKINRLIACHNNREQRVMTFSDTAAESWGYNEQKRNLERKDGLWGSRWL